MGHHFEIQSGGISCRLLALKCFHFHFIVILGSFNQFNRSFSILRIYSNRLYFKLSFRIRSLGKVISFKYLILLRILEHVVR